MAALYDINTENHFYLIVSVLTGHSSSLSVEYLPVSYIHRPSQLKKERAGEEF